MDGSGTAGRLLPTIAARAGPEWFSGRQMWMRGFGRPRCKGRRLSAGSETAPEPDRQACVPSSGPANEAASHTTGLRRRTEGERVCARAPECQRIPPGRGHGPPEDQQPDGEIRAGVSCCLMPATRVRHARRARPLAPLPNPPHKGEGAPPHLPHSPGQHEHRAFP